MFLHIGENNYILKKDIVAILDRNALEVSKEDKEFIKKMMDNARLKNKELSNPKTYIITCKNSRHRKNKGEEKVYNLYLSNISSTTLLRRNKVRGTRLEVQ